MHVTYVLFAVIKSISLNHLGIKENKPYFLSFIKVAKETSSNIISVLVKERLNALKDYHFRLL